MKPGRPREENKLPDYVYFRKGRYVFIPYFGRGQRGKEEPLRISGKLLRQDATLREIWRAYDALHTADNTTLKWLLDEFMSSNHLKSLKPKTQQSYAGYRDIICRKKLKNGSTFGDLPHAAITIKTVRRYLDSRAAKISGNREVQFLKSAFSWAMQHVDDIDSNPCVGVTLNKQPPRSRYVTHDEYDLVHTIAKTSSYPYAAIAMELAYLCRARRGEVFALTRSALIDEGVYLERGKGSDSEITLWTPRLKKAIDAAKKYNSSAPIPVTGAHLLHDKKGLAIKKNAFDSAWQRIIKKALAGGLDERFTFHDLKAKGISDHEHKHGGHKSGKMKRVYDRLPDLVKATK